MSVAPLEVADAAPSFAVPGAEYQRLLGYPPGHEATERAAELMAWARDWYRANARPWFYARQAGSVALQDGRVAIDGATLGAGKLHDMLHQAGADSAMLVAVGAGDEAEREARRLWDDGRPDEYFFLEIYASAVVEALVSAAAFRLCEWADTRGIAVLPHYSPGYPGWDIGDQAGLLELIKGGGPGDRETGGPEKLPGELSVLASGMLQPKKSLLAVYGLTRQVERVQRLTSLVPCANCALPGCRYRRAPYREAMPQLERVAARTVSAPDQNAATASRGPLTPNAQYTVNTRTLEKWARERLTLSVQGDRSVQARFRYEGTTCSNMGQPLAFEYDIRLSSADEGYTITAAHCAPAPGDEGHRQMCEYLVQGDRLLDAVAAGPALLGRPLDEVLSWNRPRYPSGCYCNSLAREHKWGLALEVLHFALSHQERS